MSGGDDKPGVGGVGVRIDGRVSGTWDDGGGVIDAVVGGGGEVNFSTFVLCADAGEFERDTECMRGVAGPGSSVDGMATESWEVCDNGA